MQIQFGDDEPDQALLTWLRSLDEQLLTRILTRRPDALERPWPRRLDDLARRLAERDSVMLALRQVTTPGFELIGAIHLYAALDGRPTTPAHLAERLESTPDEIEAVLGSLRELALAWTDEDNHVRVTEGLRDDFGHSSLGLGQPLRSPVQRVTVDQLKTLCSTLGLPATGRKTNLVDTVVGFLGEPANVRGLVDESADDDTRELLLDGAFNGPYIGLPLSHLFHSRTSRARTAQEASIEWAIQHGLIWQHWERGAELPLEIGLALRGADYSLPFTPQPPRPTTSPVTPDRVANDCSAAALRMVDRTHGVLSTAATNPIPLLKSGGVGVRAVRNLAKELGANADEVRLAVELSCAAGLLVPAEPPEPTPAPSRGRGRRSRSKRAEPPPAPEALVPSPVFGDFSAQDAAAKLRVLLRTWWDLPQAPLADQKAVRAVVGSEPSDAFADIRQLVVALLSQVDENSGVAGGLSELVKWHVPMLTTEIVEPVVDAAVAEATRLGVVSAGAAGVLAHALAAGAGTFDESALAKATDAVVASAVTSALFGSDLTAVVPGTVEPELAGLLDRVADRESQEAASTWRFSESSVRRAFDNGANADGLLERLGDVAQGELPQPLVYLINDVARRHGQLGVMEVRCAIVGDDPTLLTEVAANRKLAELGITQLAPTVLAATATAADALAALRKAGYSPVPRASDGSIVIEGDQPTPQEPATPDSGLLATLDGEHVQLYDPDEFPPPAEPDPGEHAGRLLRQQDDPRQPLRRGDLTHHLHGMGSEYRGHNWLRLAWRLEAEVPTPVRYTDSDGTVVALHISSPELDGDTINVWSMEDDDYRTLDLRRITPG